MSLLSESYEYNKYDLEQAKQQELYTKKYLDVFDFGKFLKTCTPEICTITEAMAMDDTSGTMEETVSVVQQLEDKFNRLLSQYSRIQNDLNNEIVTNQKRYKSWKPYLGNVVDNDNMYTYVNNYGYTHKYTKAAYANNDGSCPKTTVSIDNDVLQELPKGPAMGAGQACFVAGKNVKNKKTGEVAWVDIKGYKHVYSDASWKKKNYTCNSKAITLSGDAYDAIPNGANMTDSTYCLRVDVDPNLYTQLLNLNRELVDTAKSLNEEINKLSIQDKKMENVIRKKQSLLQNYVQSLDTDRNKIDGFKKNFAVLDAQESDSKLMYTANYYEYMAWTLGALAFGLVTIKLVSSQPSS
jgi:hypothetical protein